MVRTLIKHGSLSEDSHRNGFSLIKEAVSSGEQYILDAILDMRLAFPLRDYPPSTEPPNAHESALILAARMNNRAAIETLCTRSPLAQPLPFWLPRLALFAASDGPAMDTAEAIFALNPDLDPNISWFNNELGVGQAVRNTPLERAAHWGDSALVKLLLERLCGSNIRP